MRLSLLTCAALMAATLSSAYSLKSVVGALPSIVNQAKEEGRLHSPNAFLEIFKHGSPNTTPYWQVTGTASSLNFLHGWYDRYIWNKAVELGRRISNADTLIRRATELHPPAKVYEFKESVDSVISTSTTLHQMVLATAEQHGVSPDSVKEEFGIISHAIVEKLKELFPPPGEAPGHENRVATVNAILDFIDEIFLQFAIKFGVSEESLKVYSDPLKFHVQIVVVTIGDLVEQHPELAMALLFAAMIEMGIFESLLIQVLEILGFSPLGPVKGSVAAWLQRWLFPSAIPKGGWFAALQRLAMTRTKAPWRIS